MGRLVDLSHTVEDGLITYKGLPAPIICDYMSREASKAHYADGTTFHIGRIDMVANTGTYVDSPFHRFADGADLSELALESLADIEGVLVRIRAATASVGAAAFDGLDVAGKAVLVQTDWSRHWSTDQYFEGHPFLTEDAAIALRDRGARIVGIDSYNIDDVSGSTRPVHTVLLGAGIPIVEHMCRLGELPTSGFRFHAVPVKIKGFGTFPVRAYAVISRSSST